jgi:hypothetical protein
MSAPTWKPSQDEIRAILTELHPLLHGREQAPTLDGWAVPEPPSPQPTPSKARHSAG